MTDIKEHVITKKKGWFGNYHFKVRQPIGFFMNTQKHIQLQKQYEIEKRLLTEWLEENAPYAQLKEQPRENYEGAGHRHNQLHLDFTFKLKAPDAVAFKLRFQ